MILHQSVSGDVLHFKCFIKRFIRNHNYPSLIKFYFILEELTTVDKSTIMSINRAYGGETIWQTVRKLILKAILFGMIVNIFALLQARKCLLTTQRLSICVSVSMAKNTEIVLFIRIVNLSVKAVPWMGAASCYKGELDYGAINKNATV